MKINIYIKEILIIIAVQFLMFGCHKDAQSPAWIKQESGTSNALLSVYFIDANTGYVVGGNGTIVKTIDGGNNWITQTSNTTSGLMSVYFIDASKGFAVGGYPNDSTYTSYSGTLLRTIDGGTHWTIALDVTNSALRNIAFITRDSGYCVGDNKILKTTDGGENWSEFTYDRSYFISIGYFINANVGFTVGNNGTINKTINGGVTFTTQRSNTQLMLYSIHFIDANTGFAAGGFFNSGVVLKTIDGGSNWTVQLGGGVMLLEGSNYGLYAVHFIDANNGFVCGGNWYDGAILITHDGGTSFKVQTFKNSGDLNSIFFIDNKIGYVVGANGTILKTGIGGD